MLEDNSLEPQMKHKEEASGRIQLDAKDRSAIQSALEMHIDPLDPVQHDGNIINIISGRVGPPSLNVHNAVAIGTAQMQEFENAWPEGFYNVISQRVITMAATKKNIPCTEGKIFDTSLIYSRVIGLQASSRDIDLKDVFAHELAPVPTSMFFDNGEMRICKGKSTLKNLLKDEVEASSRKSSNYNIAIIDGSALLWVDHWPTCGTVRVFIQNFKKLLQKQFPGQDKYLVFDRYYDFSIKAVARSGRSKDASRVHKLSMNTQLPPQKVVLGVVANKIQLINLLCTDLCSDPEFHENLKRRKLVITGTSNSK